MKKKTEKGGSPNPVKREVADLVRHRIQQYKAQRPRMKALLESDPKAPERKKEADREAAAPELERLEQVYREVIPYIRGIRSFVPDMLAQNRLAAAYFLFGKVSQGLRAIFLLARGGLHYEVMEIVRSGREALDLIALFLGEAENSPLLKKWFADEIVENEKARAAMEKLIGQGIRGMGIAPSLSEIKAGIYGTLSKFSHVSYGALLEAYDVFKDDFDFEGSAGFHYVRHSSLPYVKTETAGLIIALKGFYTTVGDRKSYGELDAILKEHTPDMFDERQRRERIDHIKTKFGEREDQGVGR
jgi:hypothetical protein